MSRFIISGYCLKTDINMIKKIDAYFRAYPEANAAVHTLIGLGFGILVTYPLVGVHPLRWGALFLTVGLIGHIYPAFLKKGKGR